jgi:hypothetical protein
VSAKINSFKAKRGAAKEDAIPEYGEAIKEVKAENQSWNANLLILKMP